MGLTVVQITGFNAISQFIKALGAEFGTKQHSLKLYARFVEHITLSNEKAISKIVETFTTFIINNQEAIETTDESKLTTERITFTEDKIYFTLKPLFKSADFDTKKVMWQHLITIYGIIFPDSKARDVLKKLKESPSHESAIISDMASKIAPHINKDETNPMNAIMGLMSSGIFTELINTVGKGMDEGTVDMASMMAKVQSMMAQDNPISSKTEIEEEK